MRYHVNPELTVAFYHTETCLSMTKISPCGEVLFLSLLLSCCLWDKLCLDRLDRLDRDELSRILLRLLRLLLLVVSQEGFSETTRVCVNCHARHPKCHVAFWTSWVRICICRNSTYREFSRPSTFVKKYILLALDVIVDIYVFAVKCYQLSWTGSQAPRTWGEGLWDKSQKMTFPCNNWWEP